MTPRITSAALFLLAGVLFVALLEKASDLACNETCPGWFLGLVMAQLLIPIAWAAVGFAAKRGKVLVWFLITLIVTSAVAYGIHLQTLVYLRGAISG